MDRKKPTRINLRLGYLCKNGAILFPKMSALKINVAFTIR